MTITPTGDATFVASGAITTGTSGATDGAADGTITITNGTHTGNNAFESITAGSSTDGVVTINSGSVVEVNSAINGNNEFLPNGMPSGIFGFTFSAVAAGRDAGSSGTINVVGADTLLDVSGNPGGVQIGDNGTGVLNVNSGATIVSQFFDVARKTGSTGTVNIDGAGSRVMVDDSNGSTFPDFPDDGGFARVSGDAGTQGFLNVTNGGSLEIANTDGQTAFANLRIGDLDGSFGRGIVSGAGSSISLSVSGVSGAGVAASGPVLTVGNLGQGLLELNNSATTTLTGNSASVNIGNGSSNGSATAQSRIDVLSGSQLNIVSSGNDSGAFVNLGRNATGNGVLFVDGAGSQVSISSDNNGNLSNSSAFLTVGRSGRGEVAITNGGTLSITGNSVNDDFPGFNVGRNAGSEGFVTIAGSGSSLTISGLNTDVIGGGGGFARIGRDGNGTFIVEDGGLFQNSSINSAAFVGENAGSTGLVEVNGAGSVFDGGLFTVVGADFDFVSDGLAGVLFTNGGSGTVTARDGGIFRSDDIFVGNTGTIAGNGTIDGNVLLDGESNELDGSTTVATLFPGTFEDPGSTLTITGDLTVNNGLLNLEIFGTTPADNDLINVAGTAALNNNELADQTTEIAISFRNGFIASAGDSFTLLNAASLTTSLTDTEIETFDDAPNQALSIGNTGTSLILRAHNSSAGQIGILDFDINAANGVNLSFFENSGELDGPSNGGSGIGGGFQDIVFRDVTGVNGTNAIDMINATSANSSLAVNSFGGDDVIIAGLSENIIDGGTNGISGDTASYEGSNSAVFISLFGGLQAGGHAQNDQLINIENLIGSNGFGDEIFGNDSNNVLTGLGGADNIAGFGGDDTLVGGQGGDVLLGGAGIDTLNGDEGADFLAGGSEDDTINGGADGDTIFGEAGADILNGDGGVDAIFGGSEGDTINGGDDGDVLFGETGDDTINGDAGVDVIFGQEGSDIISGGSENDVLFGDTSAAAVTDGDDTLNGDGGGDSLFAGGGNDMLFGGSGSDSLFGEGGDDTLSGGADLDALVGGAGDDTFVFSSGFGNDFVIDFEDNADTLNLAGLGLADANAALASGTAFQASNGVFFSFNGGVDTLMVFGDTLTVADLADDIVV